jgi:hypothetical protein
MTVCSQGMERRGEACHNHQHQSVHDHRQARHHFWTAGEISAHAVCPAEGIRRDPPHLESSFCKTYSGAVPTKNLRVCSQYHGWVRPVIQCHSRPQHICVFKVPHALTGWWHATAALQGGNAFTTLCEG